MVRLIIGRRFVNVLVVLFKWDAWLVHSAMIPGPFLNSSLPRPFCRRNPAPRSGAGPLGCRVGSRSWLALSSPRLTVRLLPIGAVAWYDCESSAQEEKTLLCRRGLEDVPS